MNQGSVQPCVSLRAIAKDVEVHFPSYQIGDYLGWQLEFSLWETNPAVTPEILRGYMDELFSSALEQFVVTGDGKFRVMIRKSEEANTPAAFQAFLNWLSVPKNLQKT